LSRYDSVFPNIYVVSNVDEVVQFRANPDFRAIEGSAIDRRICSDFYVILNFHLAYLWKFPALPALSNVAKAVRADHGTGMQDYTVSDARPGI
jgi:hypothetical protein